MEKRVFNLEELSILKRNRFKKLDLTVRVSQVLEFNQVTTIGTLLQYSREDLLNLQGQWRARINESGMRDLENELAKINLFLDK